MEVVRGAVVKSVRDRWWATVSGIGLAALAAVFGVVWGVDEPPFLITASVLFVVLLIAVFREFHELRVERDEAVGQLEPRLGLCFKPESPFVLQRLESIDGSVFVVRKIRVGVFNTGRAEGRARLVLESSSRESITSSVFPGEPLGGTDFRAVPPSDGDSPTLLIEVAYQMWPMDRHGPSNLFNLCYGNQQLQATMLTREDVRYTLRLDGATEPIRMRVVFDLEHGVGLRMRVFG